jgi:hypothetical protein
MTRMHRPLSQEAARLPDPVARWTLGGPLSGLVMRPWFDRLSLKAIEHWIFPLSRGMAAALAAGGSPEAFAAASGLEGLPRRRLRRFLAAREDIRRDYEVRHGAWEAAFFGAGDADPAGLVAAETGRRRAAQGLLTGGWALLPLRRRLASVRWDLTDPEGLAADPPAWLEDPASAYRAPDPPAVEVSRPVPGALGSERWLRFASPVMGDTAWARVYEPEGGEARATFVFLHGIAMETEFWPDMADPVNELTRRGIRVIRPEAPWHGRRRLHGWYGGEPALARGPLGFVELFRTWAAEVAVLIQWARSEGTTSAGGGPVGLGGVSLGALTSQRVAVAARDWPAAMRPDALMLVATSGRMLDISFRGSLAHAVGMPERLRTLGWSEAALAPLLPLLEPRGDSAVPPEATVMLLGRTDDVTPFAGGLELARRWRLPEENLIIRHQGHFTVWLGMGRKPQPLSRFADLLTRGAGAD